MNSIAAIQRINEAELESGAALKLSASWHAKYLKSAWCYVGNLPLKLTEGDVICIMSQFGEIEDLNLVRDEETGKSKGFAFLKYEDSKSCVLAVDNFTGSKILGRSIRVDHVEQYRLPKHLLEKEEKGRENQLKSDVHADAGHAYQNQELKGNFNIHTGQDLFAAPPPVDEGIKNEKSNRYVDDYKKRKEDKRLRKESRAQIRKEREDRRQRKDEKRRRKRADALRIQDDDKSEDAGTVNSNYQMKRDSKKRKHEHRQR